MDNPSAYYTDGSYVEVTSPQVGDRICYFSDKNTTTLYDDENIHSGIVVAVHDGTSNGVCGIANLVTVHSKWGAYWLYEHRGDECPYVETSATIQYFSEPPTGYADYIKFYRRHAGHSYTDHYESIDINTHKAYCFCGEYITENHDYNYRIEKNSTTHTRTCYCTKEEKDLHTFNLNAKYCNVCNYYCNHTYAYQYLNTSLHYTTCSKCSYLKNSPHIFESSTSRYCIDCKRLIMDDGFGQIIGPLSATLVSLNGSYVLPSGNIVLVPEDKESYYNGTLVFYNRNELPEAA